MRHQSLQKRLIEQASEYGVSALTDADLVCICVGIRRERMLRELETALAEYGGLQKVVADRSVANVLLTQGEGEAHARLAAVMELSRRLLRPEGRKHQIRSQTDIVNLVAPDMRYLKHEQLRLLVLNTRNEVEANLVLYEGTVNACPLRAAEIARPAILRNCPTIALVHNHPSGNPMQSQEDVEVTQKLVEGMRLLDIDLLDHVIIGNPGSTSLKDQLGWS